MSKVGQKYYRFTEEDEIEIIRVAQFHKDSDITILINDGNNKRKVSKDYLKDFVLLNEDGLIIFNIVILGEDDKSKDVVIMLYRKEDIRERSEPYAACRQCIFDSYASINTDKMYMGLSLNRLNIPENVPFNSMLACNGIEYFESICIYNDDKLEDILKLLHDKKKFDKVLYDIFISSAGSDNKVEGFSKSLKDLIKDNYFMYDYRDSFGITQLDFNIVYDEETLELSQPQIKAIESLLNVEMFRTYVIPYSKEIDIKKIERSYKMVSDKNENFFIIAYDKGEYLNDYLKRNVKDKINIVRMMKNAMK